MRRLDGNAMCALDGANESFHRAYDDARRREAEQGAILVVLADSLHLHRGNEVRNRIIAPALFIQIKGAAHLPIGVYASLYDRTDRPLDASTARALAHVRDVSEKGASSFEGAADDEEGDGDALRETLRKTARFATVVLDEDRVTRASLEAFAREIGPLVHRLTLYATRVQLDALDAAVEELLAPFSAAERDALHVVVTGDHQARARSLGMQYFQKRLGEEAGAEMRVTYAEGVTSAEEAVALVGKQRLDRAIALAVFGDANRLQRDVLGDAAKELLEGREFPLIGDSG